MNKQERMENAVEYMTEYMRTYPTQYGYKDYSDETYIDDILYGLGASLDGKYRFAQGFDQFKKRLLEHLEDKS